MKIVFLGGGNMANALIGGMVKQGFAAADIDVIDPGAEARTKLAASYGVNCHASADTAPASPDILVLAVKPQQMKEAVAPLVGKLGNALVI
ncbi:MAG TPA: NAD(P)-binding domain-containing protein, partial [Azonexus sp.]|nr:NAD(P)-binding domain-containing protein [Azonexus sp.]